MVVVLSGWVGGWESKVGFLGVGHKWAWLELELVEGGEGLYVTFATKIMYSSTGHRHLFFLFLFVAAAGCTHIQTRPVAAGAAGVGHVFGRRSTCGGLCGWWLRPGPGCVG